MMDRTHFLLLCNRSHPVRAGARADGGFVCVCIRIGEVLFYRFFLSVTAQEKGKRHRGWRGVDRMAVEALALAPLSVCHHRCIWSANVDALCPCRYTYVCTHLHRHTWACTHMHGTQTHTNRHTDQTSHSSHQ